MHGIIPFLFYRVSNYLKELRLYSLQVSKIECEIRPDGSSILFVKLNSNILQHLNQQKLMLNTAAELLESLTEVHFNHHLVSLKIYLRIR